MTRQLTIAVPIALLGALLLGPPANAQRGFGGRAAPSGRSGSGRSFATNGRGAPRSGRGVRSGSGFRRGGWGWGYGLGLGWDYLPDPYFDSAEDYARPDYEPPMPLPPVMYEPPEPAKLVQPILIERQGNEWVKVSGYKEAPVSGQVESAKAEASENQQRATSPGERAAAEPASAIPPAVLVFRDGHQEEVKSYTIIGNTLYAKADYWAGGAWTRKIHIASLDVPATMKLNQEHGSQFRLPSGPQEIMIRP